MVYEGVQCVWRLGFRGYIGVYGVVGFQSG